VYFWFLCGNIFAQTTTHCRQVQVQYEPIFLDSLTVLPTSIRIDSLPDLIISYDMQTGYLQMKGNLPALDSITVCYERLPYNLRAWARKRDTLMIDTTNTYWNEVMRRTDVFVPPREQLVDLKDFRKSGNFVRGLSLGNAQNVFVNSALNLQLEGKISDDLTLTASISDQQIPYQPEGNTLQLQDLDRIFMKLAHKNGSLTAGDIILQNRDSHFLKFYKNIQGGLLETQYNIGKDSAQTFAGIAVARGKFYSATLIPNEGVQGPYRLLGPNGEAFIIVLANSERVFIDGKPLQRGYNYDYVIDYNVGEVIFNSHILITRFTRIRIDFEYVQANFTRSILMAGHEQRSKKWRLLSQFYREGDNPNSSQIEIPEAGKEILRNQIAGIGLINGVDSVGFNPNEIRYERRDSTNLNGTYPHILIYSTNQKEAVYQAVFSFVGKNQGDYIRINNNVNGQVYRWVEPINGVRQGDYMPLKPISLPNRRQVWTTQLTYQLQKNAQFSAEVALSSQQNNLFSNLPEATLSGIATRLAYQYAGKPFRDSTHYVWFGGASYEFNQDKFTPIDRFRSIEFDRDWGKNIDSSRLSERIFQGEIGLRNIKNNRISYKINTRNRENQVNGWQQIAQVFQQNKHFVLQSNVFLMQSKQDSLQINWQRWDVNLQYKTRYVVPIYTWEGDKNSVFLPKNDSVYRTAMHFEGHTFALRNADTMKLKYLISYNIRQDNAPLEGKLLPYLRAETLTLQTNYRSKKDRNLALTAVYRKATVHEKFATQGFKSAENLQGRLDWSGDWRVWRWEKKKERIGQDSTHTNRKNNDTLPSPVSTLSPLLLLQQNLSLTTATGQELQREYYYFLVPVGQGTHAWRDDNDNGLQELNEFYLALNPDEKKYVKIFRPTTNYIPAYTQTLAYRLNWVGVKKSKEVATLDANPKTTTNYNNQQSVFSGLLTWNVTRRFTEDNVWARLFPISEVQDTSLLAEQNVLRHTLFLFRNNWDYSGELTYQNSAQKQLLTNGFEAKRRQEIRGSWRQRLHTDWNLQGQTTYNTVQNRSDFLPNRNFEVEIYQASPELSYQSDNTKRLTLGYQYAYKTGNNLQDTTLFAQVHQVSIEGTYAKASKRNITVNVRFLQIAYNGAQNTPLAYEMLEALRVGTNFTWQMNWVERLQNGLQLTFQYEGRKSANTRLIHLGRAQIGLLF
jgi:hypothetical protein